MATGYAGHGGVTDRSAVSARMPVEDGTPALGRWQTVVLVECDGPRTRRLRVTTASSDGTV